MPFENLNDVLDKETEPVLKEGERVKLEFVSNNSKWIRASQIAIIESRLNKNPDIEIISANYWGDNFISFDVEVKNSESLMTERLIIGLIMSANPVYFYLVHKPGIKQLATDVIEKAKEVASWTPIAIAVAVIAAVVVLFKK